MPRHTNLPLMEKRPRGICIETGADGITEHELCANTPIEPSYIWGVCEVTTRRGQDRDTITTQRQTEEWHRVIQLSPSYHTWLAPINAFLDKAMAFIVVHYQMSKVLCTCVHRQSPHCLTTKHQHESEKHNHWASFRCTKQNTFQPELC